MWGKAGVEWEEGSRKCVWSVKKLKKSPVSTVHLLCVISELLPYEAETYIGLIFKCHVNIVVFRFCANCNIDNVPFSGGFPAISFIILVLQILEDGRFVYLDFSCCQ